MTTTLTWYGHAALGLETGGYKVAIDPFLSGNPSASITPEALEADFILVSHGHSDHIGDSIEIAKRTGAMVVSNFEIAGWFNDKGVAKTHGQQHGGGFRHPFGHLKLTLAFHGSALPDGSNGGNPCGFLITTNDGKKLYFAQDTALFSDMKLIGEVGLDLAVLPIGDNFTMGPDDALQAVKFLQPKAVIPIHYNTWELIAQDADAWAQRVMKETTAKAVVLKPGESYSL
ncbi:MAG: metal-dependent hydrolase [Anaerolineae bacterium UTCFX1]|jgi:L-ascorbate metabolism protein UlaG (beta-lactamase superfamily)|nr:MAG: metal-dependent hydrolase [Anaerolineae bacterium UTCFX1]